MVQNAKSRMGAHGRNTVCERRCPKNQTIHQAVTAVACGVFFTVSSAFAWTPKTHLYLAETVLKDALDDSKVAIYDTNDVLIGHYDCNTSLINAIKAFPKQYRAGVTGAYPDLVTGQTLIRPSYPGTDTWLNYFWSATAGSEGSDRAFVAGFYASAAGDLFGSSFVNYYAGGSPSTNAVSATEKQTAIEGLTEKQMPATQKYDGSGALGESDVSIQGDADKMIYDKMVDAKPGTDLRNLLAGDRAKGSIPAIYSSLKYGLTADTALYHSMLRDLDARYKKKQSAGDACNLLDLTCSKLFLYAEAGAYKISQGALIVTVGPFVLYKEAWIKNIDDGLKAWPALSHELNLALNCGNSIQMARARGLAQQYVTSHLISMTGAP
jgi:hypothetical protein